MSGRLGSMMFTTQGWPATKAANGASTYVALQAQALRDMGVRTSIFTRVLEEEPAGEGVYSYGQYLANRGALERGLDLLGGRLPRHLWLRWRDPVRLVRAVRDAVADRGVQILEMEEAWGTAGSVAPKVSIPVVVRMHGPWFLVGEALGLQIEKDFEHRVAAEGRALARARGVTAPSQFVIDSVRKKYGLELPGARVIANPVRIAPPEQHWKLADAEPNTVVFIGRFDRCKGGDLLLHAFARLAEINPDAQLIWAGPDHGLIDDSGRRWSQAEYLAHAVRDPAARKRVTLLGLKTPTEIVELRRRARIVVECSRFETFSMVVAEAVGMGCPLVTGGAGGAGEIVQHEQTALVCNPADSEAFAAAMQRLLTDDALAQRLSAAGVKRIAERYTPLEIARQSVAFYETLL